MSVFRYISTTCLATLTWLLAACSIDSPLCYDTHPHQAVVDINYDWSKVKTGRPDSMMLLATRPIYQLKYVYLTSAHESNNTGVLISGPDSAYNILEEDGTDTGNDSILFHTGDYDLLSFNGSNSLFEEDNSLRNYELIPNYATDSIWVSYKPLETLSMYPDETYRLWEDHNAYSKYLVGLESTPLYSGTAKLTIPRTANQNSTRVACLIKPVPVSQMLTIIYRCMPKEEGIAVDSVICEISGVVRSMQLLTRRLRVDQTYKALFRSDVTHKGVLDYKDIVEVRGSINVPGVVRNSSRGTLIGPGILNTALFIHYEKDGKTLHRVLRASINLFETLSQNPSVIYNENGDVVQSQPELTLVIDNLMGLYKDKIIPEDNFGADTWHDESPIYFEPDE